MRGEARATTVSRSDDILSAARAPASLVPKRCLCRAVAGILLSTARSWPLRFQANSRFVFLLFHQVNFFGGLFSFLEVCSLGEKPMELLAWTCRCLGNAPMVRALLDVQGRCNPNMRFLSETRLDSYPAECILKEGIKDVSEVCVPE